MLSSRPSWFTRVTSSILALTVLVSAAPILDLTSPATFLIPTPDVDPFYRPPSTFAKDAPGTIYRSRAALNPGFGRKGTQILFRTTDEFNKPTTSVTTILQTLISSKNYLVAYNMYEDASAPQCAPSYCFNTIPQQGFCPDGDGQLVYFMTKGWTVIVTDFEGKTSSFSVGHQSGYQILDAYRAAIKFLNLSKNVVLGGYGYSGGAIGTAWSAALQNEYAPELNIKALAFGGTPSNTTSTLLHLNAGAFAGFAVGGLAGQVASYPELYARFSQIATAKGKAAVIKGQSQCGAADLVVFAFTDILSTDFQSLGSQFLSDPIVTKYLTMSTMGSVASETPTKPSILMFHSTTDEVIPYASALTTAQTWCSDGAKITFITEVGGGGHVGTQLLYGPMTIDWLDNSLRGTSAPITSCSFETQSMTALPVRM
ncbi:BZ3500_MvSof-1268-A1-R1_Chr2-1g04638 [Microbotryum saponariae]|uniref:triacylglycerol lipase n=1 Tax=Microbotryum saponariae TaxID=289078 RepID=A0A2X0L0J4_9BASI|nr:BZ3500_MvSof-1268-A1-R1_Chr2-1g04638 [Microbotryum saponariae]SCZ92171.1 BZ3501_MvSof-1269-A2-R1_Chr2-1g04294 [Microbotryum saponariae]